MNKQHSYLNGLSWLRLGLSLYLILFHTVRNYKDMPRWIIDASSAGFISTSMFFIVSGYILTYVYYNKLGQLKISKRQFIVERFSTLYPIHIIGLLISALIIMTQYHYTGKLFAVADIPSQFDKITNESVLVKLTFDQMIINAGLHIFLLHAWNCFYLIYNIPSWSISALWFFYLVFILIGKFYSNIKNHFLTIFIINILYLMPPLYFIVTADYSSMATGMLHTNPLFRLPEFLAGIVLCSYMEKQKNVFLRPQTFIILLSSSIALHTVMLCFLLDIGPAGYYLAHNGGLLLVQILIIAIFIKMPSISNEKLTKIVNRLGNATLSIFILHLPLFYIISHIEMLIKVLLISDFDQSILAQLKGVNLSLYFYPFVIAVIVIISTVIQQEFVLRLRKPIRKLLKRYD